MFLHQQCDVEMRHTHTQDGLRTIIHPLWCVFILCRGPQDPESGWIKPHQVKVGHTDDWSSVHHEAETSHTHTHTLSRSRLEPWYCYIIDISYKLAQLIVYYAYNRNQSPPVQYKHPTGNTTQFYSTLFCQVYIFHCTCNIMKRTLNHFITQVTQEGKHLSRMLQVNRLNIKKNNFPLFFHPYKTMIYTFMFTDGN